MTNKSTRIALFAAVMLAVGLFGGLIISNTIGNGSAKADMSDPAIEALLEELDTRIEGLPAADQRFVLVARRVIPAVVTISSERIIQGRSGGNVPEEFRRMLPERFFGPRGPQQQTGLGSGVIIDSEGLILTNNHVIDEADDITVTLPDRRTLKAEVVGTDANTDIALLRVDATGLPSVTVGDSDAIEVGEWVLAVGNPFSEALRATVTAGIVSAKGRGGLGTGIADFIQTDAAINPGNSGGALVNLEGELIGINTAIISSARSSSGVGFAVPSNLASVIVKSLKENGRVVRGYLGVRPGEMTSALASSFGLDRPTGTIVEEVIEGEPAEKAGIRRGDLILEVNGKPINDAQDLVNTIGLTPPGTTVTLTVLRNSERITIDVTLTSREEDLEEELSSQSGESSHMEKLGLAIGPMNDAARRYFSGMQGALITDVAIGSPAYGAGLRQNMLITEVNGTPVTGHTMLADMIDDAQPGSYLRIYALIPIQGGQSAGRYFALEIPE